MELRNKEMKIRDYLAYQFNIVPENIEINKFDIVIGVDADILDSAPASAEEIEENVSVYLDREIKVVRK
jgi:hypothetical protein